ncbi:MAG: hypothetical protein ACR2QM_20415, partial [Longimicrobiales bacterium]
NDAASVGSATADLARLGYKQAGDFRVPEMRNLPIRGFAHPGMNFFAAVYEHPVAGVVADVVCLLQDGWTLTVTTAPETGLDQAPRSPMIRMETPERLNGLHDRMRREVPNRPRVNATPDRFAMMFVESYKREMDWRIARLGPTPEEIHRVARLSGHGVPDEMGVKMIRGLWTSAIDGFISEQVQEEFLTQTDMSANQWEKQRDQVVVVHDYCDPADRIEELSWELDGERDNARKALEEVFQGRQVREAFVAAQELLPEERRYEPVGSVAEPWAGDLYLSPEEV